MTDKSALDPNNQLNCQENFSQLQQDLFQILNKNHLDSLYNDSEYDIFLQNKKPSPLKSFNNSYYPLEKDIIKSRPLTPYKYDYSPNVLYPKSSLLLLPENSPENPKDQYYIPQDYISMGQEYPMQKPNVPYRNPFIMDPDNEDDSSDTNLLSCFWANNQKMIPNESPMKKENHLFEIKPMPIGHLPEFDDSDDFSIKTPKKPNSFLFNKAKSVFSSSRQEEKFPLNFKNFCPEQDFKNDYYNNISHSFSYPRQEKKFNPVWEQGKFLSDKKCVIFEKLSKNYSSKGDTPHRSERGLRVLSLRVKDIVCEENHTTYQKVAESLINQMETQQDLKENENNKQNIKRRVYDALNVLIAANVLKKSGKTVHIDENTGLIGKYCKSNMTQEKLKFHQKLLEMQNIVLMKKSLLQDSLLKMISLKHLVNRNKEFLKERIISNEEIIRIPFVMLVLPEEGLNSVEIIQNYRSKNQLKVLSREALSIYGDVDILLKLNFFRVEKKKLDEFLPKETHKYLPDEIKDQK